MTAIDPYLDAHAICELCLTGELTPRQVAEFFLARIERLNPEFGAFQTVAHQRAVADAEALGRLAPAAARTMPLFGVPYSLKDLLWTRDLPTTFGSRNYADYHAPADAEVALRLARAGGILLGKTTTSEFGGRPTVEGGLCATALNPWNRAHSAGGSSGGAACALAAGMGPLAQGSDGGGSVRVPAACCGVVGVKAARGRITLAPQRGESWAGYSVLGPLARTVRDAALMLDVMSGPVAGDPNWLAAPAHPFSEAASHRPGHLRLATITHSALGEVEPETLAAFEEACRAMRELGHSLEPVALDPGRMLVRASKRIIGASIGALEIKHPELMDPVVRASWEYGRTLSAVEYLEAVAEMHQRSREVVQALSPYDALLTPTMAYPAPALGTMPSQVATSGRQFSAWLPFSSWVNATGQPALSIPIGFSAAGLPIGMQIVGRPADEWGIIALGAQFERLQGFVHPTLP